jgi:anion-transporting  ArsA/GET3 family ATPase
MSDGLPSLLDHRLVVVTGKGGTGKTAVAATLSEAARRKGKRVLLAETAAIESIAGLFEKEPQPLGYQGRELRPGLHALRIDPHAALAEYLGLQTGLRSLAERMLHTETFQQLLEAAPGWRELIILGKIWHLEQKRDRSGQPRYDLVVVDAPATGHGLTFLDVPRVVQQAVRAGPLTRHASWVEALVHDRSRTLLLPVTLPEELPVLETHELIERARGDIDIAVDRIIVNRVPAPTPAGMSACLARLPEDLEFEELPRVPALRSVLEHVEKRNQLAFEQRAHVSALCGLPVVDLPDLPMGFEANGGWAEIADAILEPPVWPDVSGLSSPLPHPKGPERPKGPRGDE